MLWWTLQQLKSSNPDLRIKAARSLGSAKQRRAVPSLIKLLKDENPQVRLAVIEALGAIGHYASAEPLAAALSTPSKKAQSETAERESLAKALAGVGSAAVKPLMQALSSEEKEARRWAAFALGAIKDPLAVDSLIPKLEDSRSEVRKAAAIALGGIGDSRALKPLIKALASRDLETRRAAAEALGSMGSEEGADALMRAVADPNEPVQLAAISALGKTGGLPAALCLRSAMSANRKTVSEAAEAALKSMIFTPSSAEERAEFALVRGDFDAASREGPAAVPALIRALGFKDPQMRMKAAQFLALARSPDSIQPLLQALKDHVSAVQESAAEALASIGSAARAGLEESLSFYDASVVRLAANALGKIGDPGSVPALSKLIDSNSSVSGEYPDLFDAIRAAVGSLGRILDLSAAGIPHRDLECITSLPEKVRLLGPSPKDVDCTTLHNRAAEELLRRRS